MSAVEAHSALAIDTSAQAGFRLRRRSAALALGLYIPAAVLLLIGFACFLAPVVFSIPAPVGGNVLNANLPAFSPGHLLGTDPNGNDLLSRVLYGGRVSLLVATAVNALGLLLGGFIGSFSAYRGGLTDSIVMRTLDVLIAFPSLVVVLAVAHALGPSPLNTVWALAFFSLPAFARMARAATLRLREQPFVLAARLSGTGCGRMLLRHVLPNIFPQLAIFGLLGMGLVITLEGALSFLGLGIQPPQPSWGNMISKGQEALFETRLLVLVPSVSLVVTVLSFNLLGERLRARWSSL